MLSSALLALLAVVVGLLWWRGRREHAQQIAAWGALGLQSGWGSLVLGLGLLLASAGIWMLVPI